MIQLDSSVWGKAESGDTNKTTVSSVESLKLGKWLGNGYSRSINLYLEI